MRAPSALSVECPNCGEVTPHRVLRGRIGGGAERVFEGVVRCSRCGGTHAALQRETLPLPTPLVVSWLGESTRTVFDLASEELIEVGQRLDTSDGPVEVTAIESQGRRLATSRGKDIDVLWAKRAGQARVKFTINQGRVTTPGELLVAPDRWFTVGEEVDVGRDRVLIHRILKRTGGILHEGGAAAGEIRRVYGRRVKTREAGGGRG